MRCNSQRTALRCPMQCAAMPDAPHCVIWDKRMGEKGGIPHKAKDGSPDKAVKCGHRDEEQALGRDGGAMDETVKCGHRNEGQATGRDGGATDQNQKRCSGETECPSAPHLGGAEVHIHEPLPQGKTRCLPSSHVPQGADLGGVASGLSGCMIQANLLKASFERASDRDTA